jgi:hypothetical protein
VSRNIKIDAVALAKEVIVLRRQNEIMIAALKQLEGYGGIEFRTGIRDTGCGYGCDAPGVAMAALEAVRKEAQP